MTTEQSLRLFLSPIVPVVHRPPHCLSSSTSIKAKQAPSNNLKSLHPPDPQHLAVTKFLTQLEIQYKMHILTPLTLLLTLGQVTTAHPLRKSVHKTKSKADTSTLTEAQILTIAPTSNTCDNAPAAGECATAKTAAKYTAQSFDTYRVTNKAEQAAVLSLMAFESLDFKYNKNHFPGVAGQGSTYTPPYPYANPDLGLLFRLIPRRDPSKIWKQIANTVHQHETCNPPPTTKNTPHRCPH